jgi:hypothetical protein
MTVQREDVIEYLQTSAVRPLKYQQGETVFGVCTIHLENSAASKKLFDSREQAESHLEKLSNENYPLYNPEIHAVVFYKAIISSVGNDMRDTVAVAPGEEQIATFSDIQIMESWDVGVRADW